MPARKALVVTAHPDDECMFFTPTIIALIRHGTEVHLLCMSTGNAAGLGHVRGKEVFQACQALTVPASRVHLVDHPRLQDGMAAVWDPALVAQQVAEGVQQVQPDLVVTFDDYGVSGHPNHTAVSRGVASFHAQRQFRATAPHLQVQMLESTGLVRKYLAFLDLPLSAMLAALQGTVCHISLAPTVTWRAMRAHRSQMVWYRKLFVLLSRYTYVNTLRKL